MTFRFDMSGVDFRDLRLRRNATGHGLVFRPAPMRVLLQGNGISGCALEEMPQDGLRDLILAWYLQHRAALGPCPGDTRLAIDDLLSDNGRPPLAFDRERDSESHSTGGPLRRAMQSIRRFASGLQEAWQEPEGISPYRAFRLLFYRQP